MQMTEKIRETRETSQEKEKKDGPRSRSVAHRQRSSVIGISCGSFQNRDGLDDHGSFILRNSSENLGELLLARPGKLSSRFSPLAR